MPLPISAAKREGEEERARIIEQAKKEASDIIAKVNRFNEIGAEMANPDADFDALIEEGQALQAVGGTTLHDASRRPAGQQGLWRALGQGGLLWQGLQGWHDWQERFLARAQY